MTGITRAEGAWSVHITRRGRTVSGWFSDAVWGGSGPARLAAQYFRDETLLGIEPDIRVRLKELKRGHRTGEVGVRLEHTGWTGAGTSGLSPNGATPRAGHGGVGSWCSATGEAKRAAWPFGHAGPAWQKCGARPYFHNGQPHEYVPDFIARLDSNPAVHLILETKGHDPLKEIKVAAAHRWVNAVNADGRHGVWTYELCSDPSEVAGALDRALRSVDRLSASK